MSRLKDALERAARRNPEQSRQTFGPPSHVVPEAWPFKDADEADTLVASMPLRSEDETLLATDQFAVETQDAVSPSVLPPVVADSGVPGVALDDGAGNTGAPGERSDFWKRYPFGAKGLGKVVVGSHADPGLVEQYRRLGAALHHHQLQTGARTLMVTSAAASEGKTLTATNLALTLSHSYERRVLLIDADLRRPSLHEILRLPNSVGLSDSLRHAERSIAKYQAITSTLSVFSAGRPDSDPMAGLVSDTMNRILTEATQRFDWVIVDTPPVALLPDANLLAAMIDTALLVISANSTPYPLIRRA